MSSPRPCRVRRSPCCHSRTRFGCRCGPCQSAGREIPWPRAAASSAGRRRSRWVASKMKKLPLNAEIVPFEPGNAAHIDAIDATARHATATARARAGNLRAGAVMRLTIAGRSHAPSFKPSSPRSRRVSGIARPCQRALDQSVVRQPELSHATAGGRRGLRGSLPDGCLRGDQDHLRVGADISANLVSEPVNDIAGCHVRPLHRSRRCCRDCPSHGSRRQGSWLAKLVSSVPSGL